MRVIVASVLIFSFLLLPGSRGTTHANSLGVNLYGLSYHLNKRDRHNLNEFNQGVGVRACFNSDSSLITVFIEGGRFNDTFENQATYLSFGFQLRVWNQFRLGINAAGYSSKSIHNGETIFAPIPILSYTVSILTINAVYLPQYRMINPYHTIGTYLTISLFKAQPKK